MTLYTLVGDPHAKPDNLDKINQLFDLIEEVGNECIILGDLLDTKEVIRGSCLNTYIHRIKNSKLKFWILVGNHDFFSKDCKEHSLEPLKELDNVFVIDKYIRFGSLHFAPYMKDPTQLKELLDIAKKTGDKKSTLFCHADIQTFDYGNGRISEEGLSAKDFSYFDKVISGHYHKYQNRDNITYLGTPFSHSFGESNQTKVIGIYNTENNELELLKTSFPEHLTYEMDCSTGDQFEVNLKDINRVILKGTQEEIDRFKRQENVKYIERPNTATKASVINETQSPEVQFSKWATDIKGYSDDLLKKGLEILADV